jgi:hypothetical protein
MSIAVHQDSSYPPTVNNPDGSAAFPLIVTSPPAPLPPGATPVYGASGAVSASPAVATITSAAGRTAYLNGFQVSGLGATAAGMAGITITGLVGGTLNFAFPVPAGVGVAAPPMVVNFQTPLQASAVNTNIVVTVASFGSGNVGAAVMAEGYLI